MKAGKYSTTALLIAKAHVFLSHDSNFKDLISPEVLEWSRRFIETATGQKNYDLLCQKKYYRWFIQSYENLILPGIMKHYLLRKQFIENQTIEILNQGETNRVVIMAGGFDTLALRLAKKYPEVEFIELDHPATQEVKVRSVEDDKPKNMQFISIDYQQNKLEDVLETKKDEGTLYIAEGLLMYLSEMEVKSMFKMMTRISPDKRKIIFSYHTPAKNKKCTLVNYWLALKKENLAWNIPEKEMAVFLEDSYPNINTTLTPADLQRVKSNSKTIKVNRVLGENVCVATM
jgi:methyltransferase (TIGR00027 family)